MPLGCIQWGELHETAAHVRRTPPSRQRVDNLDPAAAFVRLRTGQLQQLHELRGGISLDHDAAGESERDGRPDGDLYGDRLRHCAVELPVAEGRCDHRGSNRRELHHRAQFASWEAG
jgi:hypothetical protein